MNGKDYNTGLYLRCQNLTGDLDTGEDRHIDIQQENIRLKHQRAGQCLLAVGGFAHYLQIVFKVQYALDSMPQQRMVISYQNLY